VANHCAISGRRAIDVIEQATHDMPAPLSVAVVTEYGKDPFLILISCLLSLRAKDTKTISVVRKLFSVARTPHGFVKMSQHDLEKLIYSIGFYKQKARTIKAVSARLLRDFGGKVPKTREELLSINGIGQKTANLVLSTAYDIPAICVDVHVHRLSNLLGLVHTKTPEETEVALEKVLPKSYWIRTNEVLVTLGQNIKTVFPRLPSGMQQCLASLVSNR
jgi:endonuclease-3